MGKEGEIIMYNYDYVTKEQWKPVRDDLEKLIHLVQDEVRSDFTFSYRFIGSAARNMITCDKTKNIGFDFDVNLYVNDTGELSAQKIRQKLMRAFNKYGKEYKYESAEDRKPVFTIKVVDHRNSKILHSCDVAIVKYYINKYGEERQKYIFFDNKQNKYKWQKQLRKFYELREKEEWIKDNKLWHCVRSIYLDKKNNNLDKNKKSSSLYAETINEIYNTMNQEVKIDNKVVNNGYYNVNIW